MMLRFAEANPHVTEHKQRTGAEAPRRRRAKSPSQAPGTEAPRVAEAIEPPQRPAWPQAVTPRKKPYRHPDGNRSGEAGRRSEESQLATPAAHPRVIGGGDTAEAASSDLREARPQLRREAVEARAGHPKAADSKCLVGVPKEANRANPAETRRKRSGACCSTGSKLPEAREANSQSAPSCPPKRADDRARRNFTKQPTTRLYSADESVAVALQLPATHCSILPWALFPLQGHSSPAPTRCLPHRRVQGLSAETDAPCALAFRRSGEPQRP